MSGRQVSWRTKIRLGLVGRSLLLAVFLCPWNYAYPAAAQEATPAPRERERFIAQLVAAALERTRHS